MLFYSLGNDIDYKDVSELPLDWSLKTKLSFTSHQVGSIVIGISQDSNRNTNFFQGVFRHIPLVMPTMAGYRVWEIMKKNIFSPRIRQGYY